MYGATEGGAEGLTEASGGGLSEDGLSIKYIHSIKYAVFMADLVSQSALGSGSWSVLGVAEV